MKKSTMIKIATGAAALLLMSTSAQAGYTMKKKVGGIDTKLTFFGFAQLEMVGGKGMQIAEAGSKANADTNVAFRAQRIRLGWKYVAGKVRGKVFLDFNQDATGASDHTNGDSVPKLVKDAFISYVQDPAFVVKAGLIKMPNGMGFTMPGWNLDIAERGFDKKLVLERNIGLMISGRDMGLGNNGKVNGFEMGHERPWKGFGYDIMIANQASRSAAAGSTPMGGNSYAVRGMFDYTEKLHIETSYGLSENADANVTKTQNGTSEDYSNINIGIDSNLGKLSLKAEYFDAKNIKGTKDRDEQVFTATAAYFVLPSLELVAKHMQADATWADSTKDTSLGNTYLGFNYFISSPYQDFTRKAKRTRNQHKVVFNYIIASGDTGVNAGKWNGLGGYRENAFIAQYQFKF
ncbi:MAG: porin [Sulfurimonas sp.]